MWLSGLSAPARCRNETRESLLRSLGNRGLNERIEVRSWVDLHQERAAPLARERHELVWYLDRSRSPDEEQDVDPARQEGAEGLPRRVVGFAEEDHVRTSDSPATRTPGKLRERSSPGWDRARLIETALAESVSVKLDHGARARARVQVIDVLRREEESRRALLE